MKVKMRTNINMKISRKFPKLKLIHQDFRLKLTESATLDKKFLILTLNFN